MMSSGNFSALRRSTLLRLSTRSRSGAARVAAVLAGAACAAAALAGAACVWAAVLSSARHPHVSHMLFPSFERTCPCKQRPTQDALLLRGPPDVRSALDATPRQFALSLSELYCRYT